MKMNHIRPVIDHTPPSTRSAYPSLIPDKVKDSPQMRSLWFKYEGEPRGRSKIIFQGKPLIFWAELTDYSLVHIRRLYRQGKLTDFLKNKGFSDDKAS